MNNGVREEDQIMFEACDEWTLARTPGDLAEAADTMFLSLNGTILFRMREALVKDYDKRRIERVEQGLPPLQWSRDDLLPDAQTKEAVFIRTAEFMRGLNREILRRQAKANL